MELVYLWVEEYKNIRNQGFNFSPRFECEFFPEYDENKKLKDNCELKITPKDYVSIFPDNINATAIVGENGSGKSSVLETLIYLIDSTTILKDKNNSLIFYHKNKWNILTHASIDFKLIFNGINQKINKINRKEKTINCLLSIFVNSITDLTHSMKYRELGDFFENYKNGIQPKVKGYKFDDVEKENFVIKFLDLLVDENSFFNFLDKKLIFDSYYFFAPIKINIDIKENNQCKLLKELNSKTYEKKDNTELIILLRIILSNVIELLRNEIVNYTDKFIEILSNKYGNIDLDKFNYQNYEEICKTINNYLDSIKNEAYIKIHQKEVEFITKVSTFDKSYIDNLFEVWKFDKYEQDVYTETFEITKDIFNDKNELFKLLFEKNYIKIDFFRNKDVSYQQLSSGEKLYLKHFTNIAYSVKYFQNNKHPMYLMLLDEIELSFHPEWQKKIILSIKNIIKKLNKQNKEFHFILTSHSPFILSDIPKKNVIFLEKYKKDEDKNQKEGNCKIATPDINQTFGANIHTLLSHGFFMEDGLMGEFAKEKINQVYNFIVQRDTNFIKTKEEAQNIINLIGEPLIKKQLQKLFDETFNKSNLTLDDEIELLEKKLNALKELKNDKN